MAEEEVRSASQESESVPDARESAPVSADSGQSEAPAKVLPPGVRFAIAAAIVLLLLFLVSWAGVRQANEMRRAELGKGVDAIAAALTIPLLETASVQYEGRRSRLQRVAGDIASAAGYQQVTITDAEGRVLASVDKNLERATIPEMAAPADKRDKVSGGVLLVTRDIKIGPTRLGSVRIGTSP